MERVLSARHHPKQQDTQMTDEPTRDFEKMLDLNRSQLTRDVVSQFEDAMRRQQTAIDDIKEITAVAKEQEFGPRDIGAMKKIAKLRLQDKGGDAKEQLEALSRIGKVVGFDLFDWAGIE